MLSKILKKTDVKKNLMISVIGVGIGQLIHLGTTPVISRLYTPEVFGQYSLFMSFFGILTAISLMKWELAIITAEENEVGTLNYILKRIGQLITSIVIITTITLWTLESEYLIIFIFLSIITFISNRFWTQRSIINKEKNFKTLSIGKISENVTNSFIAIALAYTSIKDLGLFIGKSSGLLLSYFFFKISTKGEYKENKNKIREIAAKYKNYPLYSFPAELVNHLSQSTSIFLFTYFFSAIEVGLIGLTTRVLSVPANFISISFFDVYKQKAVQDYKAYGSFRTIFNKFFIVLFALAIAMVLLISLTGPTLFEFVFGAQWIRAGLYAKYLTILYAVKLIAVPLTFSLEIKNKHYINLIFSSLYLLFGVTIIPIVYYYTKSDIECIKAYSFLLSSVYLIHIFLAFKASGKEIKN